MDNKTYIGRTEYYYDGDDDFSIFTPDYWAWKNTPDELAGDIYELTDAGEELIYQWSDDLNVGYNLGTGRCKGLAREYSKEQMWELLTGSAEYTTRMR